MSVSIVGRRAAITIGLFTGVSLPGLALAQSTLPVPPVRSTIDERGVDVTSGNLALSETELSIGHPGKEGLTYRRYWAGQNGWRHDYLITALANSSTKVTVTIADGSYGFTLSNGFWTSDQGDGSQLTEDANSYTYTASDGTAYYLDKTLFAAGAGYYGLATAAATLITTPTGHKTYLNYKTDQYVVDPTHTGIVVRSVRLRSVRTSEGYQLKYSYATDTPSDQENWYRISKVQAINNAIDYCDPDADTCPGLTQNWPAVSYSRNASGSNIDDAATDPMNRTRHYVINPQGRMIGFRRPSASTDTTTYSYDANGRISGVTHSGGGTYIYAFSVSGGNLVADVTTPSIAAPRRYTTRMADNFVLSERDEANQTTTRTPDIYGRLLLVQAPEGNALSYEYDNRGNITAKWIFPKSGGGQFKFYEATYAATCYTPNTCNKPQTVTENGTTTSYFYNANGTLDYMSGAPVNGIAPETHFGYGNVQASVKTAGGTYALSDAVAVLTTVSACRTTAWPCATSDQRVDTRAYQSGNGQNAQITSLTNASGDGALTRTTNLFYDNVGNLTTSSGPFGSFSYAYNAARQQTARSLQLTCCVSSSSRRSEIAYNSDGLVSSVTSGLYTSGFFGTGFTPYQSVEYGYDALGRKLSETLKDGLGTAQSVTQYSYNSANRLECAAQRMNLASLPSSACTPGTPGSYGEDRISQTLYTARGEVDRVKTGYGTSLAHDEVTYSYSTNGRVRTLTDGRGNVTAYSYDSFDRPLRTCYASTVTACDAASASDYVQLGYDSASRLASRSIRGAPGDIVAYGYDALSRIQYVNNPAPDADVGLAYDNFGNLTSASDQNGLTLAYGFDLLGRKISEGDQISTRTMQYNLADQLTRVTWPDSRYITYTYTAGGDPFNILESGTTQLVSYGYDQLGRIKTRAYGAAGATVATNSYAYGAAGKDAWASSLTTDFAGTGYDVTRTFAYNPAGEIVSRATSNDAFVFGGYATVDRSYTANALNQYTASGAVVPTYDAKGNLTSAGSLTYGFDKSNRMTSATGGVQMGYDPLGRLAWTTGSPAFTRFVYQGAQISAEYDYSNVLKRRYVYGPSDDEPVVWYEGADFSDKRYLVSDERGSIQAITDASGNVLKVNSYDEYGIPASGNEGRFQYTGQAWLPEIGMYSYKARNYSPSLGRFLQPDPIGHGDGPNMYAYVGNNPVNRTDPSGLFTVFAPYECGLFCESHKFDYSTFTFSSGPGPGGDGGVPTFEVQAPKPPKKQKPKPAPKANNACSGDFNTYSIGGSVTVALGVGLNISASIGISVPKNGNFFGIQYFGGAQASGMLGVGGFAGFGLTGSSGTNHGMMQSFDHGGFAYAEGDVGAGFALGASVQANKSSTSTTVGLPVPKVGAGAGAYAGVGAGYGATVATPTLCN